MRGRSLQPQQDNCLLNYRDVVTMDKANSIVGPSLYKENPASPLVSASPALPALPFGGSYATMAAESCLREGETLMPRDKEKQYASIKASEEKNYSRLTLKVRNEWEFRETVKKIADAKGESVNGFMIKAIRDAVRKEGGNFPTPVLEQVEE